jgi:hypothetical protein
MLLLLPLMLLPLILLSLLLLLLLLPLMLLPLILLSLLLLMLLPLLLLLLLLSGGASRRRQRACASCDQRPGLLDTAAHGSWHGGAGPRLAEGEVGA